jgi:uncharacterized membrane protein
MTEPYASDLSPPRPAIHAGDDDKTMPIVVYILFILGWASAGLTALVGFVMAYSLKGKSADWVRTHYVFAIRTAWLALIGWVFVGLLLVLGTPLTLIFVGFLLWKLAFVLGGLIGVWVTVRCVVGMIYAARSEPYPRPAAWIV